MNPTVSVIIPTYNRTALLREAIASVQAQTFTDWELLVIDDGSTDETPETVRTIRQHEPRLRYFHQANQGVAAARNLGIAKARGTYVAFLDDDDQWVPTKLAVQLAFMDARPALGLSYTRYWFVGGQSDRPVVYPTQLSATMEALIGENYIGTSTVMVKRSALEAVGGFDEACRLNEDYALWLRIAQRFPIGGVQKPLAVYTHRPHLPHLSQDRIAIELSHIPVLNRLDLSGRWRHCSPLRRRRIARCHYKAGRLHWDRREYLAAARHFARATWCDPLVRVSFRAPHEEGLRLALSVVKSHLAAPWCALKGLLHAAR